MRMLHLAAMVPMLVGFAAISLAAEGVDKAVSLIRNGTFAVVADGKPQDWSVSGDANVTQELTVVQEPQQPPFARLSCTRFSGVTAASHAMLVQADLALKKGQTYEFTAQVRAKDIRGGAISIALRNTTNWTDLGLSSEVGVSDRWTTIRRVFKATQDTTKGNRLQIWFTETGTLDIRDVRLVLISEQAAKLTDVVPAGESRNLVRNGSFECGTDGWSSIGESTGWGNLAFVHANIQRGGAPDGDAFVRIPLGANRTPSLFFDYYLPTARREPSPRLANLGWIAADPAKRYTLSCQMRATEAGIPAVLGIVERTAAGWMRQDRKQVSLTTQWTSYAFTFKPQNRYVYVVAGPLLKEHRTADVDVDCIQLEQGEQPTAYVAHSPLQLTLAPTARAGISFGGEPAGVEVRLANSSDTAKDVAIELDASDFFGQTRKLPSLKVSVPPKTSAAHRVSLPSDWRGFYELRATSPEITGQQTMRLAIVPKRESRDTVCGINHAFADGQLIPLADAAGVSWYRDWSLKWQHIEPKQSQWQWQIGDQQIDRVLKEGMQVLPLLPPFPSADWNSEAPAALPNSESKSERLRQAWAPRDPAQLAAFISKAVERYKGRINVWEFLNEPLYTDYALPADDANRYGTKKYTPADYVRLLAIASQAMKSADPNCRVIGGLGGGPLQNRTRELMAEGLLQHIDILNLHMYPGLRAPEAIAPEMAGQLKLMDASGGRKPIWITEFSYYGTDKLPRDPFIPVSWNWAENRLLADERQCADYTIRYFLIMLSHGVERIFIHSGNSGEVNNPGYECALFDYGGTPRKLLPALGNLTALLGPKPRSVGITRIDNGAWCAAFETGTQSVVAVWAAGDIRARLPTRDNLTWTDIMGQPLKAAPTQLSPSPAYLIAPSGHAAKLLEEIKSR